MLAPAGTPADIIKRLNAEFNRIIAGGPKTHLAIDYSRPASLETYEALQKRDTVRLMGDIAYYYLRYVDDILKLDPGVRFICIKRDRTEIERDLRHQRKHGHGDDSRQEPRGQ